MKKIHVRVALFQGLNIVLFWWLLSTVMNVCSLTFDYMQIDWHGIQFVRPTLVQATIGEFD